MNAFPNLEFLLKMLDFSVGIIIGAIRLFLWTLFMPVLIIGWCFYHPQQAWIYICAGPGLMWNSPLRYLVYFIAAIIAIKILWRTWVKYSRRPDPEAERQDKLYEMLTAAGQKVTLDRRGHVVLQS